VTITSWISAAPARVLSGRSSGWSEWVIRADAPASMALVAARSRMPTFAPGKI